MFVSCKLRRLGAKISLLAVLLLALHPVTAFAAPSGDELLLKPWIPKSMPWDGSWGAFNTSAPERILSACNLASTQEEVNAIRSALRDFLLTMGDDWNRIRSSDEYKTGRQRQRAWQQDIRSRIRTGEAANTPALDKASAKVDLPNRLRTALNSIRVNEINDYNDLVAAVNDASKGCVPEPSAVKAVGRYLDGISIGAFFKDPLLTFVRILAGIFGLPFAFIYDLTADFAFPVFFSTPHVERGESLLSNVGLGQPPGGAKSSKSLGFDVKLAQGKSEKGRVIIVDSSGRAVKEFHDTANRDNIWIATAIALRYLVSIFYGVAFFAALALYLIRRGREGQFDIRQVFPKIILSVLAMAAFPFLAGALITISNQLINSLFSRFGNSIPFELTQSIVGYTAGLTENGGFGAILEMILTVLNSIMLALMTLILSVVGALRQIALIVFIILAPIAIFSIVIKQQPFFFKKWLSSFVQLVFVIPVTVSVVFAITLAIQHNLFANGSNTIAGLGRLMTPLLLLIVAVIFASRLVGLLGAISGYQLPVASQFIGVGGLLGAKVAGKLMGPTAGSWVLSKTNKALEWANSKEAEQARKRGARFLGGELVLGRSGIQAAAEKHHQFKRMQTSSNYYGSPFMIAKVMAANMLGTGDLNDREVGRRAREISPMLEDLLLKEGPEKLAEVAEKELSSLYGTNVAIAEREMKKTALTAAMVAATPFKGAREELKKRRRTILANKYDTSWMKEGHRDSADYVRQKLFKEYGVKLDDTKEEASSSKNESRKANDDRRRRYRTENKGRGPEKGPRSKNTSDSKSSSESGKRASRGGRSSSGGSSSKGSSSRGSSGGGAKRG